MNLATATGFFIGIGGTALASRFVPDVWLAAAAIAGIALIPLLLSGSRREAAPARVRKDDPPR